MGLKREHRDKEWKKGDKPSGKGDQSLTITNNHVIEVSLMSFKSSSEERDNKQWSVSLRSPKQIVKGTTKMFSLLKTSQSQKCFLKGYKCPVWMVMCVSLASHLSIRSPRDKIAVLKSDLMKFITRCIINKLPIKPYRHGSRELNPLVML